MRLLVTNDDGILAHGIECLIAAAEPLGEVHRRRAGSRAERDEPFAHAASSAASGAARRAALAGRRHADRLRDARRRGADARAPGLRAERHQPRPEHGRGRALLGHRRRGDGRTRARHSVDRHLVRRRRPARRRDAAASSRCRCSRRCSSISRRSRAFPPNTLFNVNLPPLAGGRGEGRASSRDSAAACTRSPSRR